MQQIEKTLALSEDLQRLVRASAEIQDADFMDEEAVSYSLKSIFIGRNRLKLAENGRPHVDFYLQMLECPPECREERIAQAEDDALRSKLQTAHGDLIRLTGAEDYRLEGLPDPFDFSWAAPLVNQKKDKQGEGGVKVERLKNRQLQLDLCLRIRPELSPDRANRFLTNVMRSMPMRSRNPVDVVYSFVFASGEALGDMDEKRAFVRRMLSLMAEHYQHAGAETAARQEEAARLERERISRGLAALREEFKAAKERDSQQIADLKVRMQEGLDAYRCRSISRQEWMPLKRDIEQQLAALKQAQQERGTLRQLEQQYLAQEHSQQRMVETATISRQFAFIRPGDKEDFELRYLAELDQLDLLDNHYAARRHLRENLEAVGAISDRLIQGRRKTAGHNELYEIRLMGAGNASSFVVEDMLLPAWQSIGRDFLVACGGVLPADFPDRDKLYACFSDALGQEIIARKAPSREALQTQLQTDCRYYGPFFFRALRRYHESAAPDNPIRRRIELLIAVQNRFCTLMEDDNILQYIASDYDYECIMGSGAKRWPKEMPSRSKSTRLEKITAKASKPFALNRNDVEDVPRSLLLLTELARIDNHLTGDPVAHINAVLVRCGYPVLYARRKLDQFVLAALYFMNLRREQGGESMDDLPDSIRSGMKSFLKKWIMEPMDRLERQLKVEKMNQEQPEEARDKPRRPRGERS